jgi:hypothetical protein
MGSPGASMYVRFGTGCLGTNCGGYVLASHICRIFGYKVDRRRVWHDGVDFRTACGRCATPLLRGRRAWREFDDVTDADMSRSPHPRTGEP